MKKTIIIVLSLAMLFSLCACGHSSEPTQTEQSAPTAGMPNPWVEYSSLQELNDAYGTNLAHPPVMGVTDEHFSACDMGEYTIAQYKFDLNGIEYCFRCAPTTEDISGFYIDGKTAFEGKDAGEKYVFTDEAKLSRWFYTDGQYCLICKDEKVMDEETFKMISSEMEDITFPGMTEGEKRAKYQEMQGFYQDEYSQRATAQVTAFEDNAYIEISWSSSAFETNVWTMNAKISEDGLLTYDNERATIQTSDAQGQISEETVAENVSGFFSIGEDGRLYWNGAQDESCRNCVFAKIG